MTHDFDVPYREEDLGVVSGGFTQTAGEHAIVVEGQCPRCHGHTKTEYPWLVPGTKGRFSRLRRQVKPLDMLSVEVLVCECMYTHPEQPAQPMFLGCGAQWRVRS
jgi:hypothetical protein